jgi:hypothetical protein
VNDRLADDGRTSKVGTVTAARLVDLQPDERNPNAGTQRGRAMVEASLRRFGAGRSILVDRHDRIIAGNTTHEAAVDVGLDGAIVVETTGQQLVVVKRTDLDLDTDAAARELAIIDNRSGEVGLAWDPGVLAGLAADAAVDLSSMFSPVELADLLGADAPIPRFEPTHAEHRLDELQPHCRTCTCRQGVR